MNLPPPSLRLPMVAALLCGLLVLLCVSNLISFHDHHALFLEKYAFVTERKRLVQTQDLYNIVSRVQGQLTHISATLGLDHLDQGFDRARDAREAFHAGLTNLQQLLTKHPLNLPFATETLSLGNRFDAFHQQGIEMAHAYIQKGTFQGNQKMKGFDTTADALRTVLNGMVHHHEQQAESWRQKIQNRPQAFVPPSGLTSLLWFHWMGDQIRTQYVQAMTILVQSASRDDLRMQVSLIAQELQGLVIHVQQWLTDQAATREQDGLDDGREEARKGSERFQSLMPDFLALVERSGNPAWQHTAEQLSTRFATFHALGETMAATYIQGGAKHGNARMAEFDAMANQLEQELAPFIAQAIEDALNENFQYDLIYDSLQEIWTVLFFLLFLAITAAVGVAAWLLSCMHFLGNTK
ncbi:MAG: hypothetical protein HQL91_01070 [Magnetococcales bacterium]|nr:hypothetical protein [Magnetococcales bacterium]